MVVKVVSLNIWMGELLPAALEWLNRQDADIVLLQEVTNARDPRLAAKHRVFQELKNGLDYPHHDFVQSLAYAQPEGKIPQGNAIFSRFPIKTMPPRFFIEPDREYYEHAPEIWPLVPRLLQRAELDTPAGAVNVLNIHGIWDLKGDDYSPARQKMTGIMLEEIKDRPNVILAGDSNASQGNPLWQVVEGHLKSALPGGLKSTFNMRRKDRPGYATAAVDVIYVSPGISVLSAGCPDVDISDHLPVTATLDIS